MRDNNHNISMSMDPGRWKVFIIPRHLFPQETTPIHKGYAAPSSYTLKDGVKDFSNVSGLPTLANLAREFGLTGGYRTRWYRGGEYIIFKTPSSLRNLFPRNYYRANHPKILDLAIGKKGGANFFRSSGILTIVLFGAVDIREEFLNDHSTLTSFGVTFASDITKTLAASLAGYLTFAALAPSGFVVIPVAAGIYVGYKVSAILEETDTSCQLTESFYS